MKIIKSLSYLRKEAQWSLPGDPNLPPGVTQRMIDDQAGPPEDISPDLRGESEIDVNWAEFNEWYNTGGEPLPGDIGARVNSSPIWLEYMYSYDYNTADASDVKAVKLKDYATDQFVTDPSILEAFVDYYINDIKSDIQIAEEDNRLEHSPDYNPFSD